MTVKSRMNLRGTATATQKNAAEHQATPPRGAATDRRASADPGSGRSGLVAVSLAVCMAAAFFAATSIVGDFDTVARVAGILWVLLLSTIVLLPLVRPVVRRRSPE